MTEPVAQRAWRAACSFCGAPVEFRSAASPMAVCSYCRSTLVREGEALRRIGESAVLLDDHSPLALGASGRYQGEPFTLVGRVQMAYLDEQAAPGEEGRWSEWHALFDNGRSGWLSEDNGAYVFSFELPAATPPPDLARLAPGQSLILDRQPWVVGSVVQARVHAAQGELAFVPDFKHRFQLVELRNTQGEVQSIDTSTQPPRRYVGQAVQLAQMAMSGLADLGAPREAAIKGQGLECPNCGAPLVPQLGSTRSISCGACHSVVDISQGLGKDLKAYAQDNGLAPLIPLGSVGTLRVGGEPSASWQVVGYQERCDEPATADDEQTFWREYLLYNQKQGFAFLVDALDGWSIVRPITGVPSSLKDTVLFSGVSYRKQDTYTAKTTYVLGEFYWAVRRHQRSLNTDYLGTGAHAKARLNREKTGSEVTWSAGEAVDHQAVMAAFRIDQAQVQRFRRDVRPSSSGGGSSIMTILIITLMMLLIIFLVTRCSDECDSVRDTYGSASNEYRQCRASASSGSGSGGHGGSYGGYSSGGFHK